MSRLARWLVVKDTLVLRAHLERLADTDNLKRIIVSHHQTIVHDAADVLRRVALTI